MNPARKQAYLYLILVVLIWGAAPSIIKFALNEISPFFFLFYRFVITVVLLTPFYLLSKGKGLKLSNIVPVTIASFLSSTATLGLLFYGTSLTTSLDASLISATSPIFIILAGVLFLNERITKREKAGILITILGTLVVAAQSFFETNQPQAPNTLLGNLLIFASNIVFAASVLISKRALRQNVSAFSLMYITFVIGLITIYPFAVKEVSSGEMIQKVLSLSFSAHVSIIYMAIFSGAIAYYLYQKAQKTIEASEAAVFLYLQPLVTAPVGILWLGEKVTPAFLIGSIIIALGVILAELKKPKKE